MAVRSHEPIARGDDDDDGHVDVADPARRAEAADRRSRLPDRRFGVLGHGVEHAALAFRQHAGEEWPGHAPVNRCWDHGRDLVQLLQRTGEWPQVDRGEVGRRRGEHQSAHPIPVATPHQLGDRAAHRVTDDDRSAHAEHVHQGHCIVGAVLEGERVVPTDPRPCPRWSSATTWYRSASLSIVADQFSDPVAVQPWSNSTVGAADEGCGRS